MKTVENARHLRDAILLAFEMAEIATDPVERAEWLTFVVIGAGPTGVELVGQVAELAHKVLPRDYRTVNTREAQILLLEGAGAVLGPFPEKLREYSRNKLESMGVDVRLNTLAVDMDDESITVKGPDGMEVIRTRTRIWAAGVQASPLAKLLAQKAGLEVDRAGRIPVQPDCSLAGHPEVFALGDMVALNNLPGVAQPAMQEGKYVGKLIAGRLSGDEKTEPFKYFDKGNMATIGHRSAIADAFGMKFTGVIGYTMWGFIHVLYLIGWGNRIGTIYTWARALTFSRNRGHRLITFDDARSFGAADDGERAADAEKRAAVPEAARRTPKSARPYPAARPTPKSAWPCPTPRARSAQKPRPPVRRHPHRTVDLAVARVAAGALHGLEEHPSAQHVGVEVAELALCVAVVEHAELPQLVDVGGGEAGVEVVVVVVRDVQQRRTGGAGAAGEREHVVARERDVLRVGHPGRPVAAAQRRHRRHTRTVRPRSLTARLRTRPNGAAISDACWVSRPSRER